MAWAMASRCRMPWLYVLDLPVRPRRPGRRSPAPRRSCASAARPAGGPPVQPQVVQAGQVRQEARPLDQRAEPGQHRRAGHQPVPEDVDLARRSAGSAPSAPAAWWSCRRRSARAGRPPARAGPEVHVGHRDEAVRVLLAQAAHDQRACPRTPGATDAVLAAAPAADHGDDHDEPDRDGGEQAGEHPAPDASRRWRSASPVDGRQASTAPSASATV